jgi:hypothetical protein
MRQGQVGEPDAFVGCRLECGIRPSATDHQRDVIALALPGLQPRGERLGGECGSALVEGDDAHAFGDGGFDPLAFGGIECFEGLGAARLGLDGAQFELEFRREALGVVAAWSETTYHLQRLRDNQLMLRGRLACGLLGCRRGSWRQPSWPAPC